DGFSSITIGSSGGAVNVAVATFSDPLLLQTSGVGAINVNGPLTGTGNGSISLASGSGGIALNSPISTVSSLVLNSGGSISGGGLLSAASLSLSAASGIGAVNVPLSTNVAVLTANNSTTGDVAITNAGNVGVGVFRNQAAGGVLRLATNNGSITSGSGAVSANGGTIILSASDGSAGGNITVGAGGIVSNGGRVALHAADTITVNGVVSTGGGNAELIAGTAPGIDNTQLVDPAVESVSDDNGQIVLNAPLNVGTGNALLVAASSADAAYPSGISQSGAGAVTAGTLTAVTLHGAGGSGNGGASIALNGAANSASVLNLFACAAAGCPTAASGALSALAPVIRTGAVNYADGAIAYSGAGSATVAGLATANDASLYLPLDLTLNAAPDARNLQLQAGRDLAIDLPQAMPALTGSGTFSFIAGRNLAYNAYAAGATFGTAAAAFPRNLNFSAGNSVTLANSLYTGNLQVSAGQAVNLTGNHVVSGSDITIAAPTLNVLGSAASNIMNQSGVGQQLVATGTINLAVPGGITVKAGSYNGVSDGAAIVHANTINIGSAGARAGSLTITGGSATVTGTTNHAADAAVTAAGNMNVFLAGNLALAGGSASIAASAGSQQSATARGMLTAAGMTLDVGGNVSLTGGTAFAASGGNTADASAVLTVNSALAPVIGGSLSLTGGTATAQPVAGRSANALSGALFTVEGDFAPQIGSNLVVQGGTANADTSAGGTPADADASAVLAAQGVGNFVIGNDFNVLGGSSVARGSGASASAIGGVSAGSVPTALTLKVTTGHDLNMQGGSENGAGAVSSAVILSSGEVQMNIGGQIGGQISGGAGSGLFDNNSGRITGRGYPITIVGNLGLFQQNGSGDAFILSGAPPADLDQLLSAVLTAVDQSKLLRSFGIENDVNLRHRDTEEGQSCR
ncbi:MAG TPA: hypothetical protein VFM11_07530, partial [Burkholderiales bacterium]|nr:hypothetical protein [Burkholderiales bacterium]